MTCQHCRITANPQDVRDRLMRAIHAAAIEAGAAEEPREAAEWAHVALTSARVLDLIPRA